MNNLATGLGRVWTGEPHVSHAAFHKRRRPRAKRGLPKKGKVPWVGTTALQDEIGASEIDRPVKPDQKVDTRITVQVAVEEGVTTLLEIAQLFG